MIRAPHNILKRMIFLENQINFGANPFAPRHNVRCNHATLFRTEAGRCTQFRILAQLLFDVNIQLTDNIFQFEVKQVRIDEIGDFDGKSFFLFGFCTLWHFCCLFFFFLFCTRKIIYAICVNNRCKNLCLITSTVKFLLALLRFAVKYTNVVSHAFLLHQVDFCIKFQ